MPSKYIEIAALLRSQILDGAFQNTKKLPTEMELAETFNANRQTVRRALAMLTQEGLIESRQGSGSYIKEKMPVHGNVIAIISTYINDYIFPAILQDAQTAFSRNGYSTMVYCTHNLVSLERKALESILDSPVCGLLVEGTKTALPNPNLDLYEQLRDSGIPVMFIHGAYSDIPNAVCVSDDNYHGGYLLTKYLIKKGHSSIAGVFKSDDIQGHNRYFGFISALRDKGFSIPDSKILWYTTEEKKLILRRDNPVILQDFAKRLTEEVSAVVCYNDEIACALIEVLISQGVRVPEDIAVVSFDNSSFSELCSPKITSLAHGTKHIGRIAAERLIEMLHGKTVESESVPWTLVEKESS